MLEYHLVGKQVVLSLALEYLEALKPMGVSGSPILARVHKVEEKGLWLDNPKFPVCPMPVKRLYDAKGEVFCRAHVFVPAGAVLSIAVFPNEVEGIENNPGIRQIGFAASPKPKHERKG